MVPREDRGEGEGLTCQPEGTSLTLGTQCQWMMGACGQFPGLLQGQWPARLLCPWILQARILEWVATPSSRGSSQPRHRAFHRLLRTFC